MLVDLPKKRKALFDVKANYSKRGLGKIMRAVPRLDTQSTHLASQRLRLS